MALTSYFTEIVPAAEAPRVALALCNGPKGRC
jgi:hypothetical protein